MIRVVSYTVAITNLHVVIYHDSVTKLVVGSDFRFWTDHLGHMYDNAEMHHSGAT